MTETAARRLVKFLLWPVAAALVSLMAALLLVAEIIGWVYGDAYFDLWCQFQKDAFAAINPFEVKP